MANKILFSSLFVFALLVSSWAKSIGPVDDSKNFIVETEDGEKYSFTPQEYIIYSALVGLRDLTQSYADGAAEVAVQLLEDVELRDHQGNTVKEFKKNITKFIDEYNQMDDIEELFSVASLFDETTSQYFEMEPAAATPEQLTIGAKLRFYDADDLETKLKEAFEVFDDKFLQQLQEFKSRLTSEELEKINGLPEWENNFRQIQDTEDKFEYFFLFFELFKDE